MEYMHRIGETFYIRLPIPQDLQSHFQSKEIKKSLHTKCRKSAKVMLIKLVSEYQQQFFNMRYSRTMDNRPPSPEGLDIFAKRHPGVSPIREMILTEFGKVTPKYQDALMSIEDALDAGYVYDSTGYFDATKPPQNPPRHVQTTATHTVQQVVTPAAVQQVAAATTPPQAKTVLLTTAVKEWLDEITCGTDGDAAVKKSTYELYERSTRYFSELVGKKCDVVSAATRFNDYRADLLGGVTRAKKLQKTSAVAYLGAIKVFYAWCNTRAKPYTAVLPATKRIKKSDAEILQKGNKPYTSEEIQQILDALVSIPADSIDDRKRNLSFVYYCLTLLFTGFRKEEARIIDRPDFRVIDGVPVLDLPPAKIEQYKNLNAPRIMPIHKKLSALYLAKFVKSRDSEQVFAYSYVVYRTRMNAILYGLGIKTRPYEKLFHSMRHVFDTALSTIGSCPDSHRLMLMGHGKQGMDKTYVTIVEHHVPAFNKSVQKMRYDYDFTKLQLYLQKELNELY